jgi:hypothetical protein
MIFVQVSTSFSSDFFRVLRRAGFLIWPLGALGTFIDQWLSDLVSDQLASPTGASDTVWLWVGLSVLLALLFPMLIACLTLGASYRSAHSISALFQQRFSFLVREQLRASGVALLWCFALILPGIWRFLQFTFVTYVVLLDSSYMQGTVNALQKSQSIFRRVWGKTLLVLFFLGFLAPLAIASLDEYQHFFSHPLTASLSSLLQTSLTVSVFLLLARLAEKGGLNESHV